MHPLPQRPDDSAAASLSAVTALSVPRGCSFLLILGGPFSLAYVLAVAAWVISPHSDRSFLEDFLFNPHGSALCMAVFFGRLLAIGHVLGSVVLWWSQFLSPPAQPTRGRRGAITIGFVLLLVLVAEALARS